MDYTKHTKENQTKLASNLNIVLAIA